MSFAKIDDNMTRGDFNERMQTIVDYFKDLSPYEDGKWVLQVEDANYWDGCREPLYCVGVSAKKYALYNRLPDGKYRIRKFSPNGVGVLARRTVSVVEHVYIGKETNAVWLEANEDTDGIIVPPIEQVLGSTGVGGAIRAHGARRIAEVDPVLKTSTLTDAADGTTAVSRDTDKIISAINKLGAVRYCCPES